MKCPKCGSSNMYSTQYQSADALLTYWVCNDCDYDSEFMPPPVEVKG